MKEISLVYEGFPDVVKVKKGGFGSIIYYITIPKEIIEKLNIKDGERVFVIIAKIKTK